MFFAASDAMAAEKLNMEMSIQSLRKSRQGNTDRSTNKGSIQMTDRIPDSTKVNYIGEMDESSVESKPLKQKQRPHTTKRLAFDDLEDQILKHKHNRLSSPVVDDPQSVHDYNPQFRASADAFTRRPDYVSGSMSGSVPVKPKKPARPQSASILKQNLMTNKLKLDSQSIDLRSEKEDEVPKSVRFDFRKELASPYSKPQNPKKQRPVSAAIRHDRRTRRAANETSFSQESFTAFGQGQGQGGQTRPQHAFDQQKKSHQDSVWTTSNLQVNGRELKPQASEKTLKFSESEVFVAFSEDANLLSNSKMNKRVNSNSTNRK